MSPRRLGVEAAVVGGVVVPGDVTVCDGEIRAVARPVSGSARGIAVAGFVDWQVNGFGGVQFGSADQQGFTRAATALSAAGIAWAAPVLLNTSLEGYLSGLGELGEFRRAAPGGGLLGAHLEGPNLSPRWCGAHDPLNFAPGEPDLVRRLVDAGPVSLVTLAPEVHGVMEMVPAWCGAGVTVSIGHSDADAATCAAARRAGASAITHCWNAHRRFAPRDPGPAGWALSDPGVTVGLIADGVHVAPEVLAMTFAAARGRVAVTTDAIAPAGTPWAREGGSAGGITVSGGEARLDDGTLAGSVATPSDMLGVLLAAGVAFPEAVESLSVPQSSALGLPSNRLRPGDRADVTVLGESHEILQLWRTGQRIL